MPRRLRGFVLAGLLLTGDVIAQQKKQADIDLQAAIRTETVSGDLKGAIKQYETVVSEYGEDRSVAAQALLHMADCYQKLGDEESRRIYERVVRDYTDQKEAVATARARLGRTESATTAKGDRAVWTGPMVDMFGRVSPDGRFITFIDWNNGSLTVHDVAEGVDHVLTPPVANYEQNAGYSVFSRDGKQIIFGWSDENNRQSFRIADFQGIRILEPRQFFLANDDVRFLDSFDWSPDRKWIAAAIRRKDGSGQIALIAVADGSLRVLKSMDWLVPERIFFSLDSKYIAYDLLGNDSSDQRDMFVLAIDGSREIPAVVHPAQEALLGWSTDGTQLLFSSDRTGSVGLWALPFADGKPQGTPELLRSDIGSSILSLGLATSGSLYLYKHISSRDIKIAPIDLNAGKLTGPPFSFTQGFLPGPKNPSWSPDGKYLAYAACDGRCLAVRSSDTGQVRKLPRTLFYLRDLRWSPDGGSFVVWGRDRKGRDGIFLIDVQSSEVSSVVYADEASRARNPEWSGDGKSIYYYNNGAALVERNLTSGAEREIIRIPRLNWDMSLSPDGRYFAVQTNEDPSTKTSSLLLVPVQGGQPRELLRSTQPEEWSSGLRTKVWTPDSRAVIVTKKSGSGLDLLLVPITGAPPRKLDIDAESWTRGNEGDFDQGFSLSPDGSHVAFLMGKSASEVWTLENFLSTLSAKK